jgi:hypothetical protein
MKPTGVPIISGCDKVATREIVRKKASLTAVINNSRRRCDSAMYEMQHYYNVLKEKQPESRPTWYAVVDGKLIGEITGVRPVTDNKGYQSLVLSVKTKPGVYSTPGK